MSFSYGSIPPPDSPPLKATPLSPAPPARTDRRSKRHTTVDVSLSDLSLNDGHSDDSLHLARRGDINSTGSFSQERAKRQSSAGAIPVPKMINPLPPHYRHPTNSPALSSSVPSLTDSRASSTSTHESSSSFASGASARSLAAKPSQASLHYDSSLHTISSSDSLSSNCEPVTPTITTFSRSRGKSISRAVGKLASDFLSLKRKGDRTESDAVPAVPALPCTRK